MVSSCLVFALSALVGCASSSGGSGSAGTGTAGNAPYKIALVVDETGADSPVGQATEAAFMSAAKYINAHGGVNGHPFDVTPIDAQSDATSALAAFQQAASGGYVALSGATISNEQSEAIPLLKSAQLLTVTSENPDPSLITQPWFYSISILPSATASTALAVAKNTLGGSLRGKRLAIAMLSSPAGDIILGDMEQDAKQDGATVVAVSRDPATTSSFTSQAAKFANSHPDAVFTYNSTPVTEIEQKALDAAGVTAAPIIALNTTYNAAALATADVPNAYAVLDVRPVTSSDLAGKAVKAAGYSMADTENAYFGRSWAAAWVMKGALAACGYPCNETTFTKIIQGTSISVPGNIELGPIKFGPSGHAGISAVEAFKWDAAKQAVVPVGGLVQVSS